MGITDTDRSLRIIRNINKCGISRLRKYCTTKPHPVKNFDRDLAILKHALRYGTTYTAHKFSITTQHADSILVKYERYALACIQA